MITGSSGTGRDPIPFLSLLPFIAGSIVLRLNQSEQTRQPQSGGILETFC